MPKVGIRQGETLCPLLFKEKFKENRNTEQLQCLGEDKAKMLTVSLLEDRYTLNDMI